MKYILEAEIELWDKGKKKYTTNGLHLEFNTKKEAIKILKKIGYPREAKNERYIT
jgi:hypothetical protein